MKKLSIIALALGALVTVQCGTANQKAKPSNTKVAQTKKKSDRPMPKAGPAPSVELQKPVEFVLENGLTVMMVENHKLPRISYTLSLDNPPYAEGDKMGKSGLLGDVLGTGTKSMSKDAFNEKIDFLGASVNIGSSGASARGLSKYKSEILDLMADAVLNPVFAKKELDDARDRTIEGLKADEKNVPSIARRVEAALTYGKSHYNGEYTTEKTLKNVSLSEIKKLYAKQFSPINAYLIIIGDFKAEEMKAKVSKLFGSWAKKAVAKTSYTNPKDLSKTTLNFIDVPNAVQSEVSLINLSELKMNSKDYFAAKMANFILGGGGEARLFNNLREAHAYTYGSYSRLGDSRYISSFRAYASVRNAVTDSAITQIMYEIDRIRNEKVSSEELELAKAKFVGGFVMNVEKPSTVATYALNMHTEKLPKDFYTNYIKNIEAITVDDIQNAAKKYFKAENLRIIVTGKASDVLPNLEKFSAQKNIPIQYFDKYANPTPKPEVKKVSADVTVASVAKKYIQAIGGLDKVKRIKSLAMESTMKVQGMEMKTTLKKTATQYMTSTVMTANQMEVMRQVYSNGKGYMKQGGQKMDLKGDMLESVKKNLGVFPELSLLDNSSAKLKGIETINDQEVYVVVDNETTHYFSVKSGLKVGQVVSVKMGERTMTSTIFFKDFKPTQGVLFPQTILAEQMGMNLEQKVTSLKVNADVSDKDFQ